MIRPEIDSDWGTFFTSLSIKRRNLREESEVFENGFLKIPENFSEIERHEEPGPHNKKLSFKKS